MPRQFTDTLGDTWTLTVNVNTLKAVKALEHEGKPVDLLAVIDRSNGLLAALTTDPCLLVAVVYLIAEKQIEAKGLTPDDFAARIVGDVIDNATAALLEELTAFFPKGRRALIERALAKFDNLQTAVAARLLERIETLDTAAVVDDILGQLPPAPLASSGKPPAPSASTLAP